MLNHVLDYMFGSYAQSHDPRSRDHGVTLVEKNQRAPKDKQWLLYSHCQYFLYSLACAPTSVLSSIKEAFKQLLKVFLKVQFLAQAEPLEQLVKCKNHFDTVRANSSNCTLLLLCFYMKILALNQLNIRQAQIFFKGFPALYHGQNRTTQSRTGL